MTTYTIPKKDYQFLYIYEGTLLNYTLKNDEFHIIVRNVDYPTFLKRFLHQIIQTR